MRACERLRYPGREIGVGGSEGDRGRQTRGDFVRKRWPGEHGMRPRRREIARHVDRKGEAARLHALAAKDQRRVARRKFGEHGAQERHGDDDEQRVEIGHIGKRAGRGQRGRERGAGKENRIAMVGVDCRDDILFARPEANGGAIGGEKLRERGAPRAAADHAEPGKAWRHAFTCHAFTPAPRTASASGSSGQRGRAAVSSGSVRPAAKRSAPAQAIIAPLSVQSQSGGATKGLSNRAAGWVSAPRIA
eukprot:Opistho-1_new@83669